MPLTAAAWQSSLVERMSWDYILFDLDGTLTNPKEGITKGVAYSLRHFGITVNDLDELTKFIGPPMHESFPEFCGFDEAKTAEAIAKFREYYNVYGWLENGPYDGIEALLEKLTLAGKTLIVATSKPEETAIRVLDHFGLAPYFEIISGATPADNSTKDTVILEALRRAEITDLSRMVMVGDRKHDILGAHKVGLPAIGVLYGFGDEAEHRACGADYIVRDVAALGDLLLN